MVKPMSLLTSLFFILFQIIQTVSPTQIVYLNESFLDPLNTRDGTSERPFNKLQDVFSYSAINVLEIQIQSNFLCNESFSNNVSKIIK